jgi:hypothetical protein
MSDDNGQLLEKLRSEVGLRMGSSFRPQPNTIKDENGEDVHVVRQWWYGWTRDKEKADAAREAGATVTSCPSRNPRFSGYEVSVNTVRRV